jgi:hypothetical protein
MLIYIYLFFFIIAIGFANLVLETINLRFEMVRAFL